MLSTSILSLARTHRQQLGDLLIGVCVHVAVLEVLLHRALQSSWEMCYTGQNTTKESEICGGRVGRGGVSTGVP